jgi:hypothetical protein
MITSLPNGIPLPSTAVKATILAIPVRKVKYSLRTTPRKIVFISGIPEPEIKNCKIFFKINNQFKDLPIAWGASK